MPLRAMEAAKLYRNGYAPEVWLTRPTEPGAALEAMGIPYVGEDFYNSRVLMHQGVPEDAIRVLQPPILNTADELSAVSAALGEERHSRVIIVTSKVHTRRVRILWQRIAPWPWTSDRTSRLGRSFRTWAMVAHYRRCTRRRSRISRHLECLGGNTAASCELVIQKKKNLLRRGGANFVRQTQEHAANLVLRMPPSDYPGKARGPFLRQTVHN